MSGVEIRVRANTTQARGELQKLEKSVGKIQSVTSGLANSIKSAVAAYSGFVSIKGIVSAADDLKNLENSIALVTGRGKESQAALQRLYAIAARGRSSIDTTAATFNRFGLALSGAGKSTEDILAVTEAVAKAATLSGASADSARAAIIQLGQGLASGELRGEELNSVLEQTPRIAQAIADGMGKPFGELRSLAKDGQITSEAVFNALISQIGAIEKEFLTLEPTIGSLSVVMRDEFTRALAAIDNIAGFSDSARGKIELLTTAFRFIADRAEINFLKLQIGLLNLRMDFQDTAKKMYDSVASIFSSDFTVEGFKESLKQASNSLKEFLGLTEEDNQESTFQKLFAKIPPLDLSGYLPNLTEITGHLIRFAENVKSIFFNIFDDVILNSTWSSLFWKGTDRIGGPKFTAAIQGVLSTLSGWANKIKTLFKDLAFGARGFNEFGEAGRGERSGGAYESINNITESVKSFTAAMSEAITKSETFNSATGFFTTRRQALSGFISEFTKDFSENGGLLGYLNKVSEKLSETTAQFSARTKANFDDFLLGTPIGNEKDGRIGGAISNTKSAVGSAVDFLSENKIAVAGGAIAGAIALALPAELKSSLAQGALFGVGYVLAAGALFLLTQPITLAIAGLAFLPAILDTVNATGLANKVGKTIGDGIVAFFKSDGEGASTGQRIISGIIEASGNFGEGLLEGLFGGKNPISQFISNLINTAGDEGFDTNPLLDKLSGALSLMLIGLTTIGVVKNGLLGVTKGLAKGIFGVAFGTLGKTNLKTQIGGILGVVDDEKVKSKAKGKGSLLGKAFSTGMRAAIAGEATKIAGEIALTSVGDGKMDETESALLDVGADTVQGAVIGGTIGSAFPLIGTAAGAIVGGLIAGAFSITTNPELRSAISEFSSSIYNSIADFLDKIPDKFGELTDAVSEKVKAWFEPVKGFFKNIFSSNDISTSVNDPRMAGNPAQYKASGGYISGPGGPRDDKIPAMLSNGEFVIQAAAVKKFGAGFLSMINNGMMPPGFMDGGYVTLLNDKAVFDAEIKRQKQTLGAALKSGDDSKVGLATKALERAEKGLGLVEIGLLQYDENGNKIIAGANIGNVKAGAGAGGSGDGETNKQAESLASSFQEDFRNSFYNALKTGDFSDIFSEIADSYSSKIIESFATGFTESLFSGLGLSGENGLLEKVFSGVEGLGSDVGKTLGDGISSSVKEGYKGSELGEGSLFTQIGSFLKGSFKTIGSLITKSIGGLGKMFGSGGSFDIFGTIGSFFGFKGSHAGGLIQNRISGGIINPGIGQAGKDSVPVMLTPGEYVIPSQRTAELFKSNNNNGAGQQTFNINVSGDVSRQTRQEIIKMIPQITGGVNAQNKENNFRR